MPNIRSLRFTQKGFTPILVLSILVVGIVVGLVLIQNPKILAPLAAEPEPNKIAVHRLYNQKHNTWYWTDSQGELEQLTANGYHDAGVLFTAYTESNVPGTTPLYRLIKANDYYWPGHELFLTTSQPEIDLLQGSTLLDQNNQVATDNRANISAWEQKDATLYVYPPTNPQPGSVPVFRLRYNDPEQKLFHGTRYYSTNDEEIKALLVTGKYLNVGIVFYGSGEAVIADQPDPAAAFTLKPATVSCAGKDQPRATLEWSPLENVQHYKVFIRDEQNTDREFQIGETQATTFTVEPAHGLQAGHNYGFLVAGVTQDQKTVYSDNAWSDRTIGRTTVPACN